MEAADSNLNSFEVKWNEVVESILEAREVFLDFKVRAITMDADQAVVADSFEMPCLRQMKLALLVEFLPEEVFAALFKLEDERRLPRICVNVVVPDCLVSELHLQPHFFAFHLNQVGQTLVVAHDHKLANHFDNRVLFRNVDLFGLPAVPVVYEPGTIELVVLEH